MNLLTQMQAESVDAVHVASLNLTNLCSLMVFCLATASIAHFLDKCMEKGMIFRGYYNWITYWLWLSKRKYDLVKHEPFKDHIESLEMPMKCFEYVNVWRCGIHHWKAIPAFEERNTKWLWKVMGGCLWCFSTWVYIALFSVIVLPFSSFIISLIGFILGIGFNYLFLEVIKKLKAPVPSGK